MIEAGDSGDDAVAEVDGATKRQERSDSGSQTCTDDADQDCCGPADLNTLAEYYFGDKSEPEPCQEQA